MTAPDGRPRGLQPVPAGDCRYCGARCYLADGHGHAHECCRAWRKAIALGYPCPSCQVARSVLRQYTQAAVLQEQDGEDAAARQVRLPALPPLPRTFPDGSAFVPEPWPGADPPLTVTGGTRAA